MLMCLFSSAVAADWRELVNLSGSWRFTIGDHPSWAEPGDVDREWEWITVPGAWENQGFNGYNGFAWYRKSFELEEVPDQWGIYLELGQVDDVDEVFVNGVRVGRSGEFPPDFQTAHTHDRRYPVPQALLHDDKPNLIAVRVFDSHLAGGIISGKVRLMINLDERATYQDLRGIWDFTPVHPGKDNYYWQSITVPSAWENQGFWNYDGEALYKRTFRLEGSREQTAWLLILGKIDDFDEVYLNGKKIGYTSDGYHFGRSRSYLELRVYAIPPTYLKLNEENEILVHVTDLGHVGGIYEGPIGLIPARDLRKYVDLD